MTSRSVQITNALGLHARAAARFVHAAGTFVAQIRVACGPRVMDAKSIMGIISLGIRKGTVITLTCEGIDENKAMDDLVELLTE